MLSLVTDKSLHVNLNKCQFFPMKTLKQNDFSYLLFSIFCDEEFFDDRRSEEEDIWIDYQFLPSEI